MDIFFVCCHATLSDGCLRDDTKGGRTCMGMSQLCNECAKKYIAITVSHVIALFPQEQPGFRKLFGRCTIMVK